MLDVKAMLDDYAKYAGEYYVNKTLNYTSLNDIYASLDKQAEARVSVEHGYNFRFLYFYIIKAFMYGYYRTHDQSIIDRIDAELDLIYKDIGELSVQEAIDGGYYDNE